MLLSDGPKGNKFANASVSKNNIDSSLHLRDGLVKTIKVSQLRNISLNSTNIASDCLHLLIDFLLAAACAKHIAALFGGMLCLTLSIPFCPAVDHVHLPFLL